MLVVSLLPLLSVLRPMRRVASLGLCGVLLSGCAGGQTGTEEHDETGGVGDSPCVVVSKQVGSDDASGLGFAADDVLAWALGQHSSVLSWDPAGGLQGANVSARLEPGTHGLQLELQLAQGAILSRHWDPRAASGAGLAVGAECPPDQLSIPVMVRFSTSDGALAEAFETELVASHPLLAEFSERIATSALAGSLSFASTSNASLRAIQIDAALYPGGTSGAIRGTIESNPGSSSDPSGSSSATQAVFARWPVNDPCGASGAGFGARRVAVPLSARVNGYSGAEAVDRINALADVAWIWATGSTTRAGWNAAASSEYACASVPKTLASGEVMTLDVPIELSFATDDERVKAKWPASLVAMPAEGARFAELELEAAIGCQRSEQNEWASTCGVPSLTLSEYDTFRVQFKATAELSMPARAAGTLTLSGALPLNCPDPMQPCPGMTWETLDTGRFGDE